ncbi:MAG: ABC transporter permease [Clostridia bacterium]|jgi:ABC-2 type transport system permease protein|nr:ABC transporter permease [Clostridia bacterium]
MAFLNNNKSKANIVMLKKSVFVLNSLVSKNIRAQYRNSTLGVVWTVLNPLLNMLVMALVFGQFFGRTMPNIDYPVYVLAGNTVFGLLRMTTTSGLTCMVENYDMLTKTRIPYYVFPVSHLLSAVVNFGFSFIALLIVMLIRIPNGVKFYWTMLMTIVPFLPALMLFSLGIALILATMYVRFRDIKHFYGVILTLWTYLTPLFYNDAILSPKVRYLMNFNPMYHFVKYFRDIVQSGIVPSLESHLIIYGCGIAALTIGLLAFGSQKKKFIMYI